MRKTKTKDTHDETTRKTMALKECQECHVGAEIKIKTNQCHGPKTEGNTCHKCMLLIIVSKQHLTYFPRWRRLLLQSRFTSHHQAHTVLVLCRIPPRCSNVCVHTQVRMFIFSHNTWKYNFQAHHESRSPSTSWYSSFIPYHFTRNGMTWICIQVHILLVFHPVEHNTYEVVSIESFILSS